MTLPAPGSAPPPRPRAALRAAIAVGLLAVSTLAGAAAAGAAPVAASAPASPPSPLGPVTEAVREALSANPGLRARRDAFVAAVHEATAAEARFLPRVDAGANAGAHRVDDALAVPATQSFRAGEVDLSVTQLLWDGLATRREADRLDHARRQRWFEFLEAAERTALAAATAWYDVVRERRLVALAEDHFVQTRVSGERVRARVQAGVGRGVDLEQVAARTAVAQSSLLEERGRLDAALERYRRVVGRPAPAGDDGLAAPDEGLPADAAALLPDALRHRPALAAARENLLAAHAVLAGRRSAWQPTVQARVRGAWGHDIEGLPGQRRDTAAELVLTWNLFAGGGDLARERQAAALLTQAEDQRDDACQDTRQDAAVAMADVTRLRAQRAFLARNVDAITKAREAYRQQFEIGQRSLLDLLNAEDELHAARRAAVSAEADLATAVAHAWAATGRLAERLGLSRPDASPADDAPEPDAGVAPGTAGCAALALAPAGTRFDELEARARALVAPPAAPPAATPASSGEGTAR